MNFENKIGLKHSETILVEHKDTAASYGSGLLEVFATPAMIALMENTAMKILIPLLDEGFGSVGTAVNIQHIKATPIGMKVECIVEIIEVDRKKIVFSVTAKDEVGEIGNGSHTRFIIENDKFMQKI